MDVIQAILDRHSVRDFSSKPISKETIMKIFEAAKFSPSGGNGQPWEVFVANGTAMEKIRARYIEAAKIPSPAPSGPPPKFSPRFVERMKLITRERLILLGLNPDDPDSGKIFKEWGTVLFRAPALAVLCANKDMPGTLDNGLFIQSVCLAAKGYGVDTFIASALVSRQDIIREELGISDDIDVVTGIALGYPNPDAIINTYRSPRRPVSEFLRYKE